MNQWGVDDLTSLLLYLYSAVILRKSYLRNIFIGNNEKWNDTTFVSQWPSNIFISIWRRLWGWSICIVTPIDTLQRQQVESYLIYGLWNDQIRFVFVKRIIPYFSVYYQTITEINVTTSNYRQDQNLNPSFQKGLLLDFKDTDSKW